MRQREAIEHLDAFCAQRKTGSIVFHVKDGVVSAVELIPVMRIDAREAPAVIASFAKAKEISISQEPGSSTVKLRVVEHRQLRIAAR